MKSITVVTCAFSLIALAPFSYGQRFATLYTMTGENPAGMAVANSALYVAADAYGSGPGQIFKLEPPSQPGGPWTGTVLHTFGGTDDGSEPAVPLDLAGTLYGTTSAGGLYFFGVLYRLAPPASPDSPWTETVLYNFDPPGTDVGYASSGLVAGPGGSFYLLTSTPNLCQLQPPSSPGGAWTGTVLYTFPDGPRAGPLNSLVAGPDGALYGTKTGGPGAVFRLTPPRTTGGAWTETVLHAFADHDGPVDNPIALTVAGDRTIYGTAYGLDRPFGSGYSALFQLTPPATPGEQWTYTNLTTPTNTEHFNTPLVMANGNLYGGITTGTGGSIFELPPPSAPGGEWTLTTLHTFTDGQLPTGNLVVEPNGDVYGITAAVPGQPSGGTVFAVTPN